MYKYGEILTRVSITVTRASRMSRDSIANESQYFPIFAQ